MAVKPRWIVFADDAGAPSPNGSPYFGYALLAVDVRRYSRFVQERAEFRVANGTFNEAKQGAVTSNGFRQVIDHVGRVIERGDAACAAVFINKARYDGYWLQTSDEKPESSHFLRNYIVRKALELVFDGIDISGATAEVVLDRVRYSVSQVENLRQYLNGNFATYGPFPIPLITDVTHADSLYVEGLQVADHLARLAHRIASRPDELEGEHARLAFLRMCSRLGAQTFEMHLDVLDIVPKGKGGG